MTIPFVTFLINVLNKSRILSYPKESCEIMGRLKVLQILSMYHEEAEQILGEEVEIIRTDDYSIANICKMVQDVDGIVLRAPARITKEVIDASPNLKVISGAGVGLDNIDVAYATEKGIPVLHAPPVNKVSTAEHTIMFIAALSKSLLDFHMEMKRANYDSRNVITTREMKGKKVGLIGFGSIAQEVAKRLVYGFDMQVTAWVREYDPIKHSIAERLNIEITTDMEYIFDESDFVSLHIPLNEDTKDLIDKNLIARMKSSAYLINTARGGIVNQDDLYQALLKKVIAGAAIDVYEVEPTPKDNPILTLSNVLLTPHVGGTTRESNFIAATTVARNVLKVLKGEVPEFIGNPSVLKRR